VLEEISAYMFRLTAASEHTVYTSWAKKQFLTVSSPSESSFATKYCILLNGNIVTLMSKI
jgi:hypothetical protein